MELENEIMRLYDVFLDGVSLGEKSKVALRMANPKGIVPNGDREHKISGLLYVSKDARNQEQITYKQYCDLGNPEYICRRNDSSLASVPGVLIPEDFDFKPEEFD